MVHVERGKRRLDVFAVLAAAACAARAAAVAVAALAGGERGGHRLGLGDRRRLVHLLVRVLPVAAVLGLLRVFALKDALGGSLGLPAHGRHLLLRHRGRLWHRLGDALGHPRQAADHAARLHGCATL